MLILHELHSLLIVLLVAGSAGRSAQSTGPSSEPPAMIVLTKIELGSTDFAKVDAKRLILKCYFVMGMRGRLIDRLQD